MRWRGKVETINEELFESKNIICLYLFIYLFLKFIYLFWERVWTREGQREREGKRESQAGSTLSAQSPTRGLISWTVRSWPDPKPRVRRLTDWTTQVPLIFFLSLFIYFEREIVCEQNRERERIPSRPYTDSTEPDVGLELTNCEIMTWWFNPFTLNLAKT